MQGLSVRMMGPSYIYVRPHIGSLQGDGEGGEKMEKQLFISSIPMLAVIRQPNRGGKIEAHTHNRSPPAGRLSTTAKYYA